MWRVGQADLYWSVGRDMLDLISMFGKEQDLCRGKRLGSSACSKKQRWATKLEFDSIYDQLVRVRRLLRRVFLCEIPRLITERPDGRDIHQMPINSTPLLVSES